MDFSKYLESRRSQLNLRLAATLPSTTNYPQNLAKAMRYSVLQNGKRLRPLLVYTAGEVFAADAKVLDIPACAIELLHVFSLVHDDLPAMDNDDLRHNQPTCHKAFGEATAILTGDALLALAFQIIADQKTLPKNIRLDLIEVLGEASGFFGMCGGQDADMHAANTIVDLPSLEKMYQLKTGALIIASLKIGVLAAAVTDASILHKITQVGKNLGLAFQIQDDLLDFEGESTHVGKQVKKDLLKGKQTYPAFVGVSAAKTKVRELFLATNEILDTLPVDTELLKLLIVSIEQRDF
ncbi:MAG: polyprenyl synthetase family protein [Gammaproteobacteria bacterium]|nr:polyprenyl synthetase family protein [Gammaproteobacteria bacterium]